MAPGTDPTWQVGELAEATGVTVRTLRHYDQVGLLRPSARTGGGPRRYTRADVHRLHDVLALRGLGLALAEIAEVLDGDGTDVEQLVSRQLAEVERQLLEHQRLRSVLADLLAAVRAAADPTAASLPDLVKRATVLTDRLTPAQRRELLESRRRQVEQLSADELAALVERRRRRMAELPADERAARQQRQSRRLPEAGGPS